MEDIVDEPVYTKPPDAPQNFFEQDIYKIMSGESTEVIQRIGWLEYRSELEGMFWEPIANTQIAEINKLLKQPEPSSPTQIDRQTVEQNIFRYMEQIRQRYPEEGSQPYFAHPDPESGVRENKFTIEGRSRALFGEEKTTRVYMAVTTDNLQGAFEHLRQALADKGALEHIILSMNLETLDNPDLRTIDNNSIIAYVPDSDPTVLTKLATAIKEAKKAHPEAFRLSPHQLAKVKASSTSEFLVPLDESSWFVEVEKEKGARSYHTNSFADMRLTIYGGLPTLVGGLPNIQRYKEAFMRYRPEVRGIAKLTDPHTGKVIPRRVAMPGLVTTK